MFNDRRMKNGKMLSVVYTFDVRNSTSIFPEWTMRTYEGLFGSYDLFKRMSMDIQIASIT